MRVSRGGRLKRGSTAGGRGTIGGGNQSRPSSELRGQHADAGTVVDPLPVSLSPDPHGIASAKAEGRSLPVSLSPDPHGITSAKAEGRSLAAVASSLSPKPEPGPD